MRWIRVSFEGEGLAFARLTRHLRNVEVFLVAGMPMPAQDPVYPTAGRIKGLGAFGRRALQIVLEGQYGHRAVIHQDGDDVVAYVGMPRSRLWSTSLRLLTHVEEGFDLRCVRVHRGRLTVHGRAKDPETAQAAVRAIMGGIGPGGECKVTGPPDLTPWLGLEPRDPCHDNERPEEPWMGPAPTTGRPSPGIDRHWLQVRFPADDAVLAGLTRIHPKARIYMEVAPPRTQHGQRIHPMSLRITGIPRMLHEQAIHAIQEVYGAIDVLEDDATSIMLHVEAPEHRLGPAGQALAPLRPEGAQVRFLLSDGDAWCFVGPAVDIALADEVKGILAMLDRPVETRRVPEDLLPDPEDWAMLAAIQG